MPSRRPIPIPAFLAVVTLTAIGVLASLPFAALALLFFGNFNFGNLWHLFVLAHSLTIPLFAIIAYVVFTFQRTRITAVVSLLVSAAACATHLLWSNPLSAGLIH